MSVAFRFVDYTADYLLALRDLLAERHLLDPELAAFFQRTIIAADQREHDLERRLNGGPDDIDSNTITADQTGITTAADLAGYTVDIPASTGRRVRIVAQMYLRQNTSAGVATVSIKEDGSSLGTVAKFNLAVGDDTRLVFYEFTTDGAPHTFQLVLAVSAGTIDLRGTLGSCFIGAD